MIRCWTQLTYALHARLDKMDALYIVYYIIFFIAYFAILNLEKIRLWNSFNNSERFKNSIINRETANCKDCLWQCLDASLRERRDARQSYFEDSGASLYFGRARQGWPFSLRPGFLTRKLRKFTLAIFVLFVENHRKIIKST